MIQMSKPWFDVAAGKLEQEDTIQKTYSCSYDKGNGYLCLANKKLIFVKVKGFLKKTYDVTLDLPYNDLNEVKLTNRFKLNIKHNGSQHFIETSDISAKTVMHAMRDVVKTSPEYKIQFVEN